MDKDYLTPSEAAELLMISPVTLRQWSQKGLLKFEQTPGGHRRYKRSTIQDFQQQHQQSQKLTGKTSLRVLITDDDKQIRSYLQEFLQTVSTSIIIDTAENGFEAGQKLHTFKPEILLLDLMMPGLNGFEVCKLIKKNPDLSHIRIITITGYHSNENIGMALAAGAEICLAKPVDPDQLVKSMGLESRA
ncbi:MAG: response regulator [Gammaproteobacteria bacterium]|nr:response regulator [Gammaproteobacteria bacterium]